MARQAGSVKWFDSTPRTMKTTQAQRDSMAVYRQKNKAKIVEARERRKLNPELAARDKESSKASWRRRVEAANEFIMLCKDNPCKDCGGKFHPFCMDFDHRDPAEKKFEISKAKCSGYTVDVLSEELKKCDLVCANCHRLRTLGHGFGHRELKYSP